MSEEDKLKKALRKATTRSLAKLRDKVAGKNVGIKDGQMGKGGFERNNTLGRVPARAFDKVKEKVKKEKVQKLFTSGVVANTTTPKFDFSGWTTEQKDQYDKLAGDPDNQAIVGQTITDYNTKQAEAGIGTGANAISSGDGAAGVAAMGATLVGGAMEQSDNAGTSIGGSALKGAGSGAAIGTQILPVWGTAIGAVVGAAAGYFGAKGKQNKMVAKRRGEADAKLQTYADSQAEGGAEAGANDPNFKPGAKGYEEFASQSGFEKYRNELYENIPKSFNKGGIIPVKKLYNNMPKLMNDGGKVVGKSGKDQVKGKNLSAEDFVVPKENAQKGAELMAKYGITPSTPTATLSKGEENVDLTAGEYIVPKESIDMLRAKGIDIMPELTALAPNAKPMNQAYRAGGEVTRQRAIVSSYNLGGNITRQRTIVSKMEHGGGVPHTGSGEEPMSKKEFVTKYYSTFEKALQGTGLYPEVALAQLFQESSKTINGKQYVASSELARNYNNLFGIKAHGKQWKGKTVDMPTTEYRNGKNVRENATWRVYDSIEDGIRGWADFLKDNPRYSDPKHNVFAAKNGKEQIKALKDAGYATDPNYESLVGSLHDEVATQVKRNPSITSINKDQSVTSQYQPRPDYSKIDNPKNISYDEEVAIRESLPQQNQGQVQALPPSAEGHGTSEGQTIYKEKDYFDPTEETHSFAKNKKAVEYYDITANEMRRRGATEQEISYVADRMEAAYVKQQTNANSQGVTPVGKLAQVGNKAIGAVDIAHTYDKAVAENHNLRAQKAELESKLMLRTGKVPHEFNPSYAFDEDAIALDKVNRTIDSRNDFARSKRTNDLISTIRPDWKSIGEKDGQINLNQNVNLSKNIVSQKTEFGDNLDAIDKRVQSTSPTKSSTAWIDTKSRAFTQTKGAAWFGAKFEEPYNDLNPKGEKPYETGRTKPEPELAPINEKAHPGYVGMEPLDKKAGESQYDYIKRKNLEADAKLKEIYDNKARAEQEDKRQETQAINQVAAEQAESKKNPFTPAPSISDPEMDMSPEQYTGDKGQEPKIPKWSKFSQMMWKLKPEGKVHGEDVLAIGQVALGFNQTNESRPVDAVPGELTSAHASSLASLSKAKQDAMTGMDPATKTLALNELEASRRTVDASLNNKFAGSGAGESLRSLNNLNKYKGIVGLASADEEVRMANKRLVPSAQQNVNQTANAVGSYKRNIFNDEMNAFTQNQASGAKLIEAGLSNFFQGRSARKMSEKDLAVLKKYGYG